MPASSRPRSRAPLGLLALLLVPVLLLLHAPILAAVIPGALVTVAGLESLQDRGDHGRALPPSAAVVGAEDIDDWRRIATAAMVSAEHRRVG